ncbi:MAG: serine hydrolase, partial [Candidatus Solibacter sp.]
MRLVEAGKLDLDRPIFDILDQFAPYNGVWGDSRLHSITVRQVLHHTGGWDRAISPQLDPVAAEGSVKVAQATGGAFPPSPDAAIRYMLAQRLDFAPGARYAYSNFGYVLLARVIEKISGQSYESFVRDVLLVPAGLGSVQKASAHLAGRLPGEVTYYDYPLAAPVNSYVSAAREKIAAPYGILNPDLNDGAAAWAGSVVDLAKFITLLDGSRRPALLSNRTFHAMLAQSQPATRVDSAGWYGLGLFVQPGQTEATWDHGGYNPGSKGYFYRFPGGIGLAFLFNGEAADGNSLSAYAAQAIVNVLFGNPRWPDTDEFARFYGPRIASGGIVNAASFQPGPLAPASLITIFGTDLGGPGVNVTLFERAADNTERPLQLLVSLPDQLNAVLPEDSVPGASNLIVRRDGVADAIAPMVIAAAAPGLFRLNAGGLAAASLVRSSPGQPQLWENVYQLDSEGNLIAKPIVFGPGDEVVTLILYGTGIRQKAGQPVSVQAGGSTLIPSYAGTQVQYPGLDQVNLELPRSLSGAGTVEITVSVGAARSNAVSLAFR